MATSRYRRVNIDGQSLYKTETRITAAALLPGTFAVIDGDNKFAQASSGTIGRLYVVDCAHHQGLGIRDQVPKDHSAVGNYVEEGREFAILVAPGTYKKDQPIAVGSSGLGAASSSNVIGYCQENVTISAGSNDFIRVRMRTVLQAPAITSLTVDPATASVEEGATVQLTVTIQPTSADQSVTWTSSDTGKATVDATGLVTGVAAGSATITATSSSDGTKSDTCTVTVTGA